MESGNGDKCTDYPHRRDPEVRGEAAISKTADYSQVQGGIKPRSQNIIVPIRVFSCYWKAFTAHGSIRLAMID